MAAETLEDRLHTLEARFDTLQRQFEERFTQTPTREKRGWQAIVGTFEDDPIYDDAMRLGREWRESQVDKAEKDTC